jgi:hypothetical protein
MKHSPVAFANAAALTIAAVYLVCAGSVVLFPGLVMSITQSWFHGFDLSSLSAFNVTFGSALEGLITSVVGMWLVGYLFGWSLEKFSKK